MALTFLPRERRLFLWGEYALLKEAPGLIGLGDLVDVSLWTPTGLRSVTGRWLPLAQAAFALAGLSTEARAGLPASCAAWARAARVALDLLAAQWVEPTVVAHGAEARFRAVRRPEVDAAVAQLAATLPLSARAAPPNEAAPSRVHTAEGAAWAFLDAVVDAVLRDPEAQRAHPVSPRRAAAAEAVQAFVGEAAEIPPRARPELAALAAAHAPPVVVARARLAIALEFPDDDRLWLGFHLQADGHPTVLVSAAEAYACAGRFLDRDGIRFEEPQRTLLRELARLERARTGTEWGPLLERALQEPFPEGMALPARQVAAFLDREVPSLQLAGVGVLLPAALVASKREEARALMRIQGDGPGLGQRGSGYSFEWEVSLGGHVLRPDEVEELTHASSPVVRLRGKWVAIDPSALAAAARTASAKRGRITAAEALRGALGGELAREGGAVSVVATGGLAELVARLQQGGTREAPPPAGFLGTLRPYQLRGLSWLAGLADLGLGGCLADDMGLGKTVQVLAWLLSRGSADPRPTLLVAPTSVVGNWHREAARFAPSLPLIRHDGPTRPRTRDDLTSTPGALVVTSYALLRRDATLLGQVSWAAVLLDEAQNIKNPSSDTARAARSLEATHRFALTGTPVENRLTDLWSIFQFAMPGLLGSYDSFRMEVARPIERGDDPAGVERLRKQLGPFLLRRTKSDPDIVRDLPAKNEMRVVCTLSREQAALYAEAVRSGLDEVAVADGMGRRARVLTLLTHLKQICNHPSHFLRDDGPLAKRSGKLDRLVEMLEEVLACSERALVFTQYTEMGHRLVRHLGDRLGIEVPFLHGGTPRLARDRIVTRFQQPDGPRVLILSVKAGGTGLNLTSASHVFHFDRWWNPAVEDQATDRAHRIGQKSTVQVHKLVCAGTLEERIDKLLESKRALAAQVIAAGEGWITELNDGDLRQLFSLASDAAIGGDSDEEADEPPPRDVSLEPIRRPARARLTPSPGAAPGSDEVQP
jgi:hypothetical protein